MENNYKVALHNDKSYYVQVDGDNLKINGESIHPDIVSTGVDEWSILHNHQSYLVKIISFNNQTKKITLSVNEEIFSMDILDQLDMLLDKMGMSHTGSVKIESIIAPMPGKVINILVEKGSVVTKGSPLLILEAMKMENVIKAVGDAIVKDIYIKNQDIVDKNQILIVME